MGRAARSDEIVLRHGVLEGEQLSQPRMPITANALTYVLAVVPAIEEVVVGRIDVDPDGQRRL